MSSVTSKSRGHESVSDPVRVEHGGAGLSPKRAVIEAVAGAAGVEPTNLGDEAGIVLYEHIDLDALDALVAGAHGTDPFVSFSVAGYEVTVNATAAVAERTR